MVIVDTSKRDIIDSAPKRQCEPYRVSIEEYSAFRKNGYLVVRGLASPAEVAEFRQHTEDLMQGKLPEQRTQMSEREMDKETGITMQGLEAPPAHLSPEEKAQYFLRIHMLHRNLELHERYLLHPRVLDVLEVIIGPDVLALQSMLFLKPPGKPGQGWHQDSYYIPTHPDTLCGAWMALDDVDEINGALWVAKGSNIEPVYPPREGYGFGDTQIVGIEPVTGISDPNDDNNDLAKIANKYDQILVTMKAGDVVFFGGHILHRSKKNFSTDRMRRSFVGHYCNARSFTQWGGEGEKPNTDLAEAYAWTGTTNGIHILARGDTHLPFAKPIFGTHCAALLPAEERQNLSKNAAVMMGSIESGLMGAMPSDPDIAHDHDDHK